MGKISLLPDQHKSGWNLKQHFEKYRGNRAAALTPGRDATFAGPASLEGAPVGLAPAEAVLVDAVPAQGAPAVTLVDSAQHSLAPQGICAAEIAAAGTEHTARYPSKDGITPELPEPDWAAAAAQVAEKTRLAAYDDTEIQQLHEIYPPDTVAGLLRPEYTLREKIALLPRGIVVLTAALLSGLIGLGVWVATTQLAAPAGEAPAAAQPADSSGVSAGFTAPGEFTGQQDTAAAGAVAGAAAGSAAGSAAPQVIVVHVVGEVHQPGVYTLPAGSRITAVLEQAGGATPAAAVEALNLARVLVDGEKITVPSAAQVAEGWVAADAAGGGAGGASSTGTSPGKINLNTATVQQLEQLPKIGAVTAANIVAWRDTHGGFQRVEQLLEVGGIGEKTLALLREHVTL